MKLEDLILLELREILDRTIYGEWIDSNTGKIYPVEEHFGHENWLEHNFYPQVLNREPPSIVDEEDMYLSAFEYGMVRIAHSSYWQLNVEGFEQPIKKVQRIIAATLAQNDLQHAAFSIWTKKGKKFNKQYKAFNLPQQRQQAMEMLR